MKLITRFTLVAMVLSVSVASHAGTMYGLGGKTCGTWLEKRRTNDHFDMGQWMLGYITAAEYYALELKESEGQAFVAYMDNYCQKKPLDAFVVGVRQLVNELTNNRKP